NLRAMETLLRNLQSPQWPNEFPPQDAAKRALGKDLFGKYCLQCHVPIADRTNPDREVKAGKTALAEIGTDPKMATNFATRRAKTGRLQGRRKFAVDLAFPGNPQRGAEESADAVLLHVVVGTILNGPFNDTTDADKEAQLGSLRARTSAASI